MTVAMAMAMAMAECEEERAAELGDGSWQRPLSEYAVYLTPSEEHRRLGLAILGAGWHTIAEGGMRWDARVMNQLRERCTKAKAGRIITIRPNHGRQAAARQRAATDPDGRAAYRRWRSPAERVIAWITAGGNRRLRYRGAFKNNARLTTRAAALNLRTLINLGLHRAEGGWALAQA
jgi:hypothetical protein